MLPKEILQRIKYIHIHTKRLLGGTRPGDHITRQKGFGLDFDQIREYQQGDDVRYIDWKSSARTGKVLVKQYYQEHSRTIMLVVDCSRSMAFGSGRDSKYLCLATIASVLALVAQHSKDRVSLILFSDGIETYIPPRTGYGHIQKIIQKLFESKPTKSITNYQEMFRCIGAKKTNDSVIFMLSDFIGLEDEALLLNSIARSHELIAVRCLDPVERVLPSVGLLTAQDIETGEYFEFEARASQLSCIHMLSQDRVDKQNKIFARWGIDLFEAKIDTDPIVDLIRFFRKRVN